VLRKARAEDRERARDLRSALEVLEELLDDAVHLRGVSAPAPVEQTQLEPARIAVAGNRRRREELDVGTLDVRGSPLQRRDDLVDRLGTLVPGYEVDDAGSVRRAGAVGQDVGSRERGDALDAGEAVACMRDRIDHLLRAFQGGAGR